MQNFWTYTEFISFMFSPANKTLCGQHKPSGIMGTCMYAQPVHAGINYIWLGSINTVKNATAHFPVYETFWVSYTKKCYFHEPT